MAHERHAARLGGGFERFERLVYRADKAERGGPHLQLAGFDPRDLGQVAREGGEAGGVAEDLLDERVAHALVVEGAVEEGFGKALHGEDGRLEFVRDVAEKLAPVVLHPAEFAQFGLERLAGAVDVPRQPVELVARGRRRRLGAGEGRRAQRVERGVDAGETPHLHGDARVGGNPGAERKNRESDAAQPREQPERSDSPRHRKGYAQGKAARAKHGEVGERRC